MFSKVLGDYTTVHIQEEVNHVKKIIFNHVKIVNKNHSLNLVRSVIQLNVGVTVKRKPLTRHWYEDVV